MSPGAGQSRALEVPEQASRGVDVPKKLYAQRISSFPFCTSLISSQSPLPAYSTATHPATPAHAYSNPSLILTDSIRTSSSYHCQTFLTEQQLTITPRPLRIPNQSSPVPLPLPTVRSLLMLLLIPSAIVTLPGDCRVEWSIPDCLKGTSFRYCEALSYVYCGDCQDSVQNTIGLCPFPNRLSG